MNTAFYFSLSPSIYAAHCQNNTIIILDAKSNQYHCIIEDAAWHLCTILDIPFIKEEGTYHSADGKNYEGKNLNYWIEEFSKQKFIVSSSAQFVKKIAPPPVRPEGLCEYQWSSKPSWEPFSNARIREIITAFIQLAKVHRLMKRQGIQGILDSIKRNTSTREKYIPSKEEISSLAAAIDAASIIYPKKSFCLAWAATFVLCALKRDWKCSLNVGVQTTPFYAHAWASCNGNVIHDDPVIAQALSTILQEPFFTMDIL